MSKKKKATTTKKTSPIDPCLYCLDLRRKSVVQRNRFKLAAKLVYHYYIPKMPDIQHESGANTNLLVIKFMEMVC